MAPTVLLAGQQAELLRRWLGARYRIELLSTGGGAAGRMQREALERGEIQLVVGTHALIQERVSFARLGLVVIDEPQRFGVEQRQRLRDKGLAPDVLVMTATPLPRSLALVACGDLAVSNLDEMPPGRQPIATEVVAEGERDRVYARLRRDLEQGAQAFVVFPRIGAAQEGGSSVLARQGWVEEALAGIPCSVLHGELAATTRQERLTAFERGDLRVLLATSLVEVGIDLPAATVMVIEGAEGFGLAQLHQLRGRVGRSEAPSRCVALHGRLSTEARQRLEVFAEIGDGFAIAEADLKLRGPGEVLGSRQSGFGVLRAADLSRDQRWLEAAVADAASLLPRLDEAGLRGLRERVEEVLSRRSS